MDRTRSNAVEINEYAQPQHRFAPLNANLPSVAYATRRPQWIIAIQRFDGSSSLLSVPLYDWDSGERLVMRAQEQLSEISRQTYYDRCMSMLVTKTLVGTAKVKHLMTCDLDPNVRYHASFEDHEHDPLLAEIFHGSIHLAGNDHAFRFDFTDIADYQGKRIMVVRRVLDKFKVARLLISLLLIAPTLGTVVAISIHGAGVGAAVSAGVGVTVSATVFALVSFLQALASWFET